MSGSSTSSQQGSVQEYTVKAPRSTKKKFNMMRFHAALDIDFKQWAHAKMERENNMKEFRSLDDELPKYGAGSEFGREQKEEARRKKFGIHMKKYKPEDQPWILSVGGKGGKKFKGIREGGVSENSSWYVFMQGKDGAFEAYPVEEWYNFKLVQRYKSLTAEEAEQHFERRNKIMNYFSVMKKDRENAQDGEEETGKKKGSHGHQLLLSELDDWMSDDESGDEEREEVEDSDDDKKKKKKNKVQAKGRTQRGGKKKKTLEGDSDDSCLEESDEFDDGAEHDYISSDSSDSEAEDDEVARKELAGVDEDDALKKLLNSDEEEEEEEKQKEEEEDEEKKDNEEKEHKDKKKKKKKKKDRKSDKEDSDGKTSDASDDDGESKKKKKSSSAGEPGSSEEGSSKRKLKDGVDSEAKKARTDIPGSTQISTPGSDSGVTEEAIRRYLMRKPMTTTELLQKFKLKKTGLSSDQLVHSIAQILKRVNPVKQMVKGKMYLSIKM